MKISPDGKRLAVTRRDDSCEYLAVLSFPELKPLTRTSFGADLDIESFYWANNTRLLVQPQRHIPGGNEFQVRHR
jgi:hypothetical protein